MAATDKFVRTKDPDAVKPYLWNWAIYLDEDTLADVEFITYHPSGDDESVTVDDFSFDDTTATAWLSGGVVNTKDLITCRITTNAGIIDDRTLYLSIKEM